MRGDRPLSDGTVYVDGVFTPHARGSTYILLRLDDRLHVYPACAGIDP